VIAVDTSVWVSVLRDSESPAASTLSALLDADEVALPLPVRIELLAGVAAKDRAGLARALAGLPVIRPEDETWSVIEQWTVRAAQAGYHFGMTDLLIAALARETGTLVWSRDSDFENLSALGLADLYD
jgi:predicted nucleic acid-binding protein